MPRELTEHEKCTQCQRLLEKGKKVVISYGIRKVSVDDIVKSAGMAKGTFYQHFESKEKYLFALIENIQHEFFAQAKVVLMDGVSEKSDLQKNVRSFIKNLFYNPEIIFFMKNEQDISSLLERTCNEELKYHKNLEVKLFEEILLLGEIDTAKVKAGVVHNYIHTIFLMLSSDLMADEELQETADLITDSLIQYIFGGAV